MKLTLITTYENIDQKWLDWWFKRCGHNYGIEGNKLPHEIVSRDPSNNEVLATTKITISHEGT